ncbi:CTTNBP2 N-terminal-like protein isoform X2 [Rhineura floridana]|nr:CTTNBP2 N-terminal-like protein isoform X2 [Rhineura floridana]XP_061487996.1 CTTNBP2 N-terminal-like protein isoform X2 [Rhineura floridana]XP_061487997.1 CTTNBP2 N-terminal-like protein isoform X2 [Rhineura floridana]XP_061487998.1 CTTNBP2 N-terminal-like protein isoform X2 [Rhineura floridana]XP_061487999.1 CTTNBP2 N-terminal-like protein isoform X2 [Rhineura floridana]XP_061488000.1 CTTNBP2 N-terminal-like protein isoform X2 [Rhineura floridana]
MNLEKLCKPELLTLFSILEGELEARDIVIEALKAQRRDTFIEERYGKYNIGDPLIALQRDFEALKEENHGVKQPVCTNPLTILKVVMKHCKNMQEKMLYQLAAAESRHRKVILDLEEERRRHAQDTAEGDDVTYMLERERERLAQQLEFEKSQVKKFEREQKKLLSQLEEERTHHHQLSALLVLECKKATAKATAKAAEEGQKVGELSMKLEKERSQVNQLEEQLAAKKKRDLQMEAHVEKQLSEFDIQREQLRAKLNREENHTKALKEEMENLRTTLKELEALHKTGSSKAENTPPNVSKVSIATATEGSTTSVACQTGSPLIESINQGSTIRLAHVLMPISATSPYSYTKANGHYDADMQATMEPAQPNVEYLQKGRPFGSAAESTRENSSCPVRTESLSPSTPPLPSSGISLSPSSTASSSLTSSPCSSPVMPKCLGGASASSPSYQSSYQVGINQRFHAARHRFQSQADQDHQSSGLQSPPSRDLPPTLVDNSVTKQLARNTVTQVLSRFTSQQGPIKPVSPNSSPFGTDYRNLASAMSPKSESSPGKVSSPLGPLSPGVKSPTIPRAERGDAPPTPPKKPLLATPTPPTKTSSQASSLGSPVDLMSSCSGNAVVANGKEIELLLPTNS